MTMSVEVTIASGPRARFGELRFSGLEKVEEDYLRGLAQWPRGKVFDRSKLAEPAVAPRSSAEPAAVDTDHEIRAARIDRTLEAAERYARTRARIKAEVRQAGGGELPATRTVYRGVDNAGTVYYGDVPPGEPDGVVVDVAPDASDGDGG